MPDDDELHARPPSSANKKQPVRKKTKRTDTSEDDITSLDLR